MPVELKSRPGKRTARSLPRTYKLLFKTSPKVMPSRGLAWADQATSGLRGQKSHMGRAKILKPSGAQRPRIPSKEARAAALQPDLRDKPKGGQWWRTEHTRSLTFTTADPRLPWRPLSSPIPGLFTTRAAIPGGAAPLKRPSGTSTEGRGRATYPQASALAAERWRSATRGGRVSPACSLLLPPVGSRLHGLAHGCFVIFISLRLMEGIKLRKKKG